MSKIIFLKIFLFSFLIWSLPSFSAQLVSSNGTVAVNGEEVTVSRNGKTIIDLNKIKFNYLEAQGWKISHSDSDKIVLTGTFPAAADFYRHVEDNETRKVELTVSREENGFWLYARPEWGRQVTLEFDYLDDHFFGLSEPLQPDNRFSPDLKNASISVEINSEGAQLQENYATAYSAFYMSSHGYGAFFDTFARGRYDFAINGRNVIHHDSGTLDWHIFIGDNGTQIHRAYYEVIGKPKPVPAWGLGPVGWRDQNDGGANEIVDDIKKMSDLRIPFTSWFVDRPYSDGAHAWSEMNFSENFANPGEWIETIRDDYGMEFMTWVATSTFGDARFEKHLAGEFTYLDLTHPESVQAYQQELKTQQHLHGVKGHKIDRADEKLPAYENWHDESVSPAERRNKYSYLMAKIHDEVLRETWGDDQITFTRAAYHRAQPYLSAIWAGDPRTSWEGLQANFANAARSAFMGFPVWGTDVGGYQGEGYIPEDLYIRWMQAGSMTGLFEIKLDGAGGEGRDRMPWRYDENFQRIFREICEDRMRFIPYLYSLAHTSGDTGTLMQPLAYRHLSDSKTYDNWDQFYVGDAILVAPVFEPGTSRTVYLPKGNWHDFDNPAARFEGGKSIDVEVPMDRLPRFVRENSIYVSGDIYRGNDQIWKDGEKQLTVHIFPGAKNSQTEFTYIDMLNKNAAGEILLKRVNKEVNVSVPAMSHKTEVEVVLDKTPKKVSVNGKSVPVNYDKETNLLLIALPEKEAVDVVVLM